MPDAVDAVVHEREADHGLERVIDSRWEARKQVHERGRVDWDPEDGGHGKRARDTVESCSEGNACDPMEGRHHIGQLLLVDGQMGRERSVFPLCDEDLLLLAPCALHCGDYVSSESHCSRHWCKSPTPRH